MNVQERRSRVAALVKAGLSEREIAKKLDVSRSTVWNDKQQTAKA
jgi:transposase